MALFRSLLYVAFIASVLIAWWVQHRRKSQPTKRVDPVLQVHPQPENAPYDLKSPRWQVRLQAVQALSNEVSPQNLALLLSAVADEDSDVREAAARAAFAYGEDALPDLHKILLSGSLESRETVARTLLENPTPASIPALVRALHEDVSAWVRVPSAQALGRLGGDDALQALAPVIHDPQTDVAQAAREALRAIGTPAARAALNMPVTPDGQQNLDF